MIKVDIKRINNVIDEIKMSGHAKYDEYGKDIVCAGVSSSLITSVNACLSFDENSIIYNEENNFYLKNVKKDNITNTILENLVRMLKSIEEDYKDNIKIDSVKSFMEN